MASAREHAEELAAELRRRLVERRRSDAASRADRGRAAARTRSSELVDAEAAVLSSPRRAELRELILRDTVGLGPLEELLGDPDVEEVMVNGPDEVYVERAGRIEPTGVRFGSEQALRDAIERILTPLGRRVDELSPMADARLADGSRVNVVIPPLAVDGPAVSIRRFTGDRPGPDELVEWGTITAELRDLLAEAVARAAQHPDQRRDRVGQDDAAQRALALRLRRRARDHDRGRRRAALAAAARRAAREQAGERRGEGGGDDPRPAAQRAADAARPDRDRRGPRAPRRSTC